MSPDATGDELLLPPRVLNAEGKERCLGIEIEFAGLEVEAAAKTVQDLFGGHIDRSSDYESHVRDTEFGDFRVEVDNQFLKRVGREDDPSLLENVVEAVAGLFAGNLTPVEICAPPIPMSRAGAIERLGRALGEQGGKGTGESLLFAFGLHFNPEVASRETADIVRTFQAFLLLQEWLFDQLDVDLSRRLTPFVRPFPDDYLASVLTLDYRPDQGAFIDDYLTHNPTRNRALDLLPLLAHLDEKRVRNHVDDELVSARPTWHYRLPNSRIGEAQVRTLHGWDSWIVVERVADNQRVFATLLHAFADFSRGGLVSDWVNLVKAEINELVP